MTTKGGVKATVKRRSAFYEIHTLAQGDGKYEFRKHRAYTLTVEAEGLGRLTIKNVIPGETLDA